MLSRLRNFVAQVERVTQQVFFLNFDKGYVKTFLNNASKDHEGGPFHYGLLIQL